MLRTNKYKAIIKLNRSGASEILNSNKAPNTKSKTPAFIRCMKSQVSFANNTSIQSRKPSTKIIIPHIGSHQYSETDKIETFVFNTLAIANIVPVNKITTPCTSQSYHGRSRRPLTISLLSSFISFSSSFYSMEYSIAS